MPEGGLKTLCYYLSQYFPHTFPVTSETDYYVRTFEIFDMFLNGRLGYADYFRQFSP